jgi:mRNA-degrading endonuclease RelE of RelBE toxin-antitoxin system
MLADWNYPITIAEMGCYASEADKLFKPEEHERLKEFLALHPESGDVIRGTGGVRKLRWPLKARSKGKDFRIVYYFRDLNMPLYLLAIYKSGEQIVTTTAWKSEMSKCVNELIVEHSKGWATIIRRDVGG